VILEVKKQERTRKNVIDNVPKGESKKTDNVVYCVMILPHFRLFLSIQFLQCQYMRLTISLDEFQDLFFIESLNHFFFFRLQDEVKIPEQRHLCRIAVSKKAQSMKL